MIKGGLILWSGQTAPGGAFDAEFHTTITTMATLLASTSKRGVAGAESSYWFVIRVEETSAALVRTGQGSPIRICYVGLVGRNA